MSLSSSVTPPIVLYINFYTDKSSERQRELVHCLNKNAELACIDKINLVVDDAGPYQQWTAKFSKINLMIFKKRPTFRDFFILINQTQEHSRQINILSNTDIHFDTSLGKLKSFLWQNVALCLSHQDRLLASSQDTWVWQGPMRNISSSSSFCLGIPGCDNRIANVLQNSGYKLHNPCKTIIATHVHKSMVRHYTEAMRLKGDYTYVEPSTLGDFSNHSKPKSKSRNSHRPHSRRHSTASIKNLRQKSKSLKPLTKRSNSVIDGLVTRKLPIVTSIRTSHVPVRFLPHRRTHRHNTVRVQSHTTLKLRRKLRTRNAATLRRRQR